MFERFVFDGIACNEYGVMCVSFASPGMKTIPSQESELKTQKSISGDIFHIISQVYTKPLTYTIQIVNKDYTPISTVQERALKKWLCKRAIYKPFCVLEKRYADIWFFANINNPKLINVCDTVGMELTVTTNAPFGFSDVRDKRWTMAGNDVIEDLYVDNDEELPIYPDLQITMNESGALTLVNNSITDVDNILKLENLTAGEIITLECGYPYISSSVQTHNIFDDFNKFWPYLIDGYNRFTVDKACMLELKYREYRKVGIV